MMTIGQAAKASGVSVKLIRYYESIALLPVADRSAGGYRVYGKPDVDILLFIRRGRQLGFSIDQIRQLLDLWRDQHRASAEVKQIALSHIDALEAKIAALRGMADALRHLADACHGDQRPDCPILTDLQQPHPAA